MSSLQKLAEKAVAGVRRCIASGDSEANAARWLREWKNANHAALKKAGVAEPRHFDPWAHLP